MRLFIGIRESGFYPMSLNSWAGDPESAWHSQDIGCPRWATLSLLTGPSTKSIKVTSTRASAGSILNS
jgi:hypothetical protein